MECCGGERHVPKLIRPKANPMATISVGQPNQGWNNPDQVHACECIALCIPRIMNAEKWRRSCGVLSGPGVVLASYWGCVLVGDLKALIFYKGKRIWPFAWLDRSFHLATQKSLGSWFCGSPTTSLISHCTCYDLYNIENFLCVLRK